MVGSPCIIRRCMDWPLLPRRGFPMIFDGVRGEDLREGTSPSWFNPAEVFVAVKYVKLLLGDASLQLGVDDIGIITPYRKQVEKIRNMLAEMRLERIKVGSVEEFQGQVLGCRNLICILQYYGKTYLKFPGSNRKVC